MEKEQFKSILNKLITSDKIICFSTKGILSKLEIEVQSIERRKHGLPDDYPIATHVATVHRIEQATTIVKNHLIRIPFTQKIIKLWSKSILLTPGVWICEEKANGPQWAKLGDRYDENSNIKFKTFVVPLTEVGRKAYFDSVVKSWQKALTYGYPAFAEQLIHVETGTDFPVIECMKICSELDSTASNDAVVADNRKPVFDNPGSTNPFETDTNTNFKEILPDEATMV